MKRSPLLPLLFWGTSALAAATFATMPIAQGQQTPQATSPLPEDTHEGITLSVDAYTHAVRGKEKFGKANPLAVGILPVEVFFKNENAIPVKVDLDSIQLEVRPDGGRKQDVDWMLPSEVAKAVAHPKGDEQPKARRFPVGDSEPKDAKSDKMLALLKPFALDTDILPPNGTIHGFLFFDVGGKIPAPGEATLYVPNLTEATSRKALMFFEVSLEGSASIQK